MLVMMQVASMVSVGLTEVVALNSNLLSAASVLGRWARQCRVGQQVGQWIVGVISFQKIFGLCGLKGHIVEIRWDVTLVHGRTTDGRRKDGM